MAHARKVQLSTLDIPHPAKSVFAHDLQKFRVQDSTMVHVQYFLALDPAPSPSSQPVARSARC